MDDLIYKLKAQTKVIKSLSAKKDELEQHAAIGYLVGFIDGLPSQDTSPDPVIADSSMNGVDFKNIITNITNIGEPLTFNGAKLVSVPDGIPWGTIVPIFPDLYDNYTWKELDDWFKSLSHIPAYIHMTMDQILRYQTLLNGSRSKLGI